MGGIVALYIAAHIRPSDAMHIVYVSCPLHGVSWRLVGAGEGLERILLSSCAAKKVQGIHALHLALHRVHVGQQSVSDACISPVAIKWLLHVQCQQICRSPCQPVSGDQICPPT